MLFNFILNVGIRLFRHAFRYNGSRFFSWVYLKGKVYINKPRSTRELKMNIREEVGALGPEILRKVIESALERERQVEANNGYHLKDIIFKTYVNIFPNYNLHFNIRQREIKSERKMLFIK